MPRIKITLFGKLNLRQGSSNIKGIETRKVQELFSYLLVFRNHAQPREVLSEILWGNESPYNARKNLRQTLWRLRSALEPIETSFRPRLLFDNEWIELQLPRTVWLDIAAFERVFNDLKGKKAQELSAHDIRLLQYAVGFCQGDLLEGIYQDWCIFERERFQTLRVLLLDKLVEFHELNQQYESGLKCALELIRHDPTNEGTHRQIMRMYFMVGNRAQALYQYQRCTTALRNELDVKPSEQTQQLYEQIRSDTYSNSLFLIQKMTSQATDLAPEINNALVRLERLADSLNKAHLYAREEINAIKQALASSLPKR